MGASGVISVWAAHDLSLSWLGKYTVAQVTIFYLLQNMAHKVSILLSNRHGDWLLESETVMVIGHLSLYLSLTYIEIQLPAVMVIGHLSLKLSWLYIDIGDYDQS